jgi:ketosteroid isomerase-like protein
MSQEWVDLVRLGFEAAQRGEMAAFDGMTTPDLVLVQPPEVPDAKTYEGRGAVAEAMEDWPNQWEDFRMDLIEILDAGDEVAVSVTRHRGRGRESGIEMDFEVFYVQRGRDGKLARLEMFFNREQAFEAAGLSQ